MPLLFLLFSYLGLSTLFKFIRFCNNSYIVKAVITNVPPDEIYEFPYELFNLIFVTYSVKNICYTRPYGRHTNKKDGEIINIRVNNADPEDILPIGADSVLFGFFYLVMAAGIVLGFIAKYIV